MKTYQIPSAIDLLVGINIAYGVTMVVVSFHIPYSLMRELEKLVQEVGFTSKSEAIREAIRLLIREYKRRSGGGVAY